MKKIMIFLLALLFVLGISAQISQARPLDRKSLGIRKIAARRISPKAESRDPHWRADPVPRSISVTVIVDHPDNIPVTIKCYAFSERGNLTAPGYTETQFGTSAVFSIPRGWDATIMAYDSELGDCAVLDNLFSNTTVHLGDNWGILIVND